jgi:hypothetical protein
MRPIGIYTSQIRKGGGGVVPRCGFSLFGGISSFFLGHSHEILNISLESSAQAQSIAKLFKQIG